MGEYIDREVAVRIAEKYGLANGSVLGRHTGLADCIASEIAALPAADVVPVVHGRWTTKHYIDGILEGTNFDECSACGYQRVFEDPALKTRYDYCPRCGAKLEQDREFPGN